MFSTFRLHCLVVAVVALVGCSRGSEQIVLADGGICPAAQQLCSGLCTDINNDRLNCGPIENSTRSIDSASRRRSAAAPAARATAKFRYRRPAA